MIGNDMRRVLSAAFVACVFTFVPIFALRLNSETAFVNSLKSVATVLWVPGAFVGFVAAFCRVDDIDFWVTGLANFAFYFGCTWLLLKTFSRARTPQT